MDVAVEAARLLPGLKFKFVGMGTRTKEFISETCADKLRNVEIVPFLQKVDLEKEYRKCKMLILPTREKYPFLLAEPGNAENLAEVIESAWSMEIKELTDYLIRKSEKYNLEFNVECHVKAFQ